MSTALSHTDAAPSAVASFSDKRCAAGGVCPNDSLVFTCEVNDTFLLRVILPSGYKKHIILGDTASDVQLPAGFTTDLLVITETGDLSRNISLMLSVENASLLNGGQITCDDSSINTITAMAGCPLAGEKSHFCEKRAYMHYIALVTSSRILVYTHYTFLHTLYSGSSLKFGAYEEFQHQNHSYHYMGIWWN